MSVSFLEPDIDKLRKQLQEQSVTVTNPQEYAIHDDDSDTEKDLLNHNNLLPTNPSSKSTTTSSALKPSLVNSSSTSSSLTNNGGTSNYTPKHHTTIKKKIKRQSTYEATMNNTASNSLLFRNRSDDSPDTGSPSDFNDPRKRSSSRRRISAANSRSSSLGRSHSKDTSKSASSERRSARNSSSTVKTSPSISATDLPLSSNNLDKYSHDPDNLLHNHDDVELEDTPFYKRVAFDTINITYHNPPAIGGFFSRPSFSAVSVGSWNATEEPDEPYSSYSVSSKHEDFKASYGSRSFLCALSSVSTSRRALKWLVEHVLEDGDELLCIKVEKETSKDTSYYQERAEELLTSIVHTIVDCSIKKINVVVELSIGSVKHVVRQAMLLYQPAIVIVGTSLKQYHKVMRYMSKKNTLSNFLINHSPVPVIIVVQEMLDKREELREPTESKLGDIIAKLKQEEEQEELEREKAIHDSEDEDEVENSINKKAYPTVSTATTLADNNNSTTTSTTTNSIQPPIITVTLDDPTLTQTTTQSSVATIDTIADFSVTTSKSEPESKQDHTAAAVPHVLVASTTSTTSTTSAASATPTNNNKSSTLSPTSSSLLPRGISKISSIPDKIISRSRSHSRSRSRSRSRNRTTSPELGLNNNMRRRSSTGFSLENYNYLAYLTARKNFENENLDDDYRQNYKSLFDDEENVTATGNNNNINNNTKSTATTLSAGNTTNSTISEIDSSFKSPINTSFSLFQHGGDSKSHHNEDDEPCDPFTQAPNSVAVPAIAISSASSSPSPYSGDSLSRTTTNNTNYLSAQRTNTSQKSLSVISTLGSEKSNGSKSNGKEKRKKSFFGSLMRRKSTV